MKGGAEFVAQSLEKYREKSHETNSENFTPNILIFSIIPLKERLRTLLSVSDS